MEDGKILSEKDVIIVWKCTSVLNMYDHIAWPEFIPTY